MANLTKALPTDDDILAATREWGNSSMTYVIQKPVAIERLPGGAPLGCCAR